ncbi:hypothetical protein EV175_005636 [Coemansia sp. RSA 1933]|nr:hypothetical protein EV175_005636 [Coemansia sp. RSA 1933]
MLTLDALVTEYGQDVDRHLIAAIWDEHTDDQARCRDIVHMLSGRAMGTQRGSASSLADSSESYSIGPLDSQSLGSVLSATDTTSTTSYSVGDGSVEAITSTDALVDFLAACFPECGADYIATKVKEIFITQDEVSIQVDPVEAIGIIGNAFYNDMESVENQKYQKIPVAGTASQSNTSLRVDDISAKYSVSGAGKNKNKKKKKSGGGRNRVRHTAITGNGSLQNSDNAWSTIDRELDSICGIFPNLSVGMVKAVYHECGANVDRAVEKLANASAGQTSEPKRNGRGPVSAKEKQKTKQIVDTLRMAFPDEDAGLLEAAAAGSPDADHAAEKLLQLKGKAEDAQSSVTTPRKGTRWHHVPELSRHRVVGSTARGGAVETNGPHDPFDRIPLSELTADARDWVAEHGTDAEHCRKRAEALVAQRNELYSKAAHAYARRTTARGHSGTALYYSIEGHKLDARARIWRMRAAQSAVAAMRRNGANVVDLHGLTRAEAVAVVLEEANAWYVRSATDGVRQQQRRPLHIVTGRGIHSPDGKAHLHPAVVRALRNDNWWFEESTGYIDVLGVRQGGTRSV